jgi:sarcosine oxidase subunit beta
MGLPKSADIVIVGGGVNGAATAFYLAKRGAGRIVVLEAAKIAHGASSRGAGILRTYYSNLREAELAIQSLATFQNWKSEVGGECGYTATGFLWLVGCEKKSDLIANISRLRQLGSNLEYLSPSSISTMQPHLSIADIGGAAYEPAGGFADPHMTTQAFCDAAARQGAQIFEQTPVISMKVQSGRIAGVKLPSGEIATRNVVVAAGGWSAKLAADVNIDLPVLPTRMSAGTVRHKPFAVSPMTFIDTKSDTYLRPTAEPGLAYVSMRDGRHNTLVDPGDFDMGEKISGQASRTAIERLRVRIPSLVASSDRVWSAFDGVTPDKCAIYGETDIDGLFLCVGASYKGFKVAPAVGRQMAEIIEHGGPSIDLSAFRLSRFAKHATPTAPLPYSLSAEF